MVVDTSFFKGNFPEQCSLEACAVDGADDAEALAAGDEVEWEEILPRSALRGDAENPFAVAPRGRVTHLRFNIYPDGGVARLRVYGEPVPDARLQPGVEVDLAALENGGLVVGCSDMFFGHRHNLILPGRSTHMGDGWETKRRRGPGHDWTIVRLAARGTIRRIEVDTDHFKGNAPGSCSVEVCDAPGLAPERLSGPRLGVDHAAPAHAAPARRAAPVRGDGAAGHPRAARDLSRRRHRAASALRAGGAVTATLDRLNALPQQEAAEQLRACCGSSRWVEAMVARRPFASVADCSRRPTRRGARRAPRTGTRRSPTTRGSVSVTPRRR